MRIIYRVFIINILLIIIPNMVLAFVKINFVPTDSGMYNLITKKESSSTINLQLTSLQNDQYSNMGSSISIDTGITLNNIVTIPISINNNQFIDKVIVIPMESGTSGDKFSSIDILDADLQNLNTSIVATSEINSIPIIIKNNKGIFLIYASHENSNNDTLKIYEINVDNNSLSEILSVDSYENISKIIPLDENTLVIIEKKFDFSVVAYVYSISKREAVYSHALTTDSNVRVEYDPNMYKTSIVSDLDDINITNAPSPFGITKIY
ncbi:hypothetical protein [Francisella salina]|uniref:Uncharacterized protein n=1 Tax=Francisella salina TaxID=573569 RepID=A0ABM5MBK1_FRAST|nr:hypothetical protein [Francisella salina]AEI36624.1 hypothetical protein F7308_1700 [Francisella salina]